MNELTPTESPSTIVPDVFWKYTQPNLSIKVLDTADTLVILGSTTALNCWAKNSLT